MSSPRILHYVFKIGNRSETARFYRDVLGMKILRHEEFTEGCKAACNGPYDGTWSKSMGINIESNSILDQARKADWVVEKDGSRVFLSAPDGYKFYIQQSEKGASQAENVSYHSVIILQTRPLPGYLSLAQIWI
ncbi:hypothetical protein CAPTEDRAFT_192179, partial [Capitella teleta]